MRFFIFILGLAATVLAQQEPVRLPPGVTRLGEIGRYRVAYQSYGGNVVEMPDSWSGHFEEKAGISYKGAHALGRPAFLLHSPWRVKPGKVWVDYRLVLPEKRPIKLAFGIAMAPEAMIPGRSDGVTFSCSLDTGKGFDELMRHHQTETTWRDYEFDLTSHAGSTVTLRLQTEPGPKSDSNYDFSYFGNLRIEAGVKADDLKETVAHLVTQPAYKAVAKKSLLPLANDPTRGIVPAPLITGTNEIREDHGAWLFSYQGEDCRIEYRYEPRNGKLDGLTASIDGGTPFPLAKNGGITFTETTALKQKSVTRDSDTVVATFAAPGCEVVWRFGIRDKALLASVACTKPIVSAFSLGQVDNASLRRRIAIKYLSSAYSENVDVVSYLPMENVFVCPYLNWTQSNASVCGRGKASYHKKTDGTRNLLSESGYIAVSPSVHEVLPNLPHPRSPYMDLLGDRIMLDVWKHHRNNSFQGDAEILRELKDNGVDHLAIIQHVWQRYGYDVKLPDHIPANPKYGGDEGMIKYGKAANECGYIWSVHENYIDIYPDAPSFDPAAQVLKEDGSLSKAWYNAVTGVQSYGLKCNRALDYAKQNAPEIHRRYETTAAYLDVHTAVGPSHQLDHEANQPFAAMARGKVHFDTNLFQFMRDTHKGPLFGEGANHMHWAGRCDGVEAQVRGGENHTPFLDFDLLRIHPQMVNHGMGYYERWYRRSYKHVPGLDSCAPFQIDKYRAQEVAYGHAGFIGDVATDNVPWIAKEHHLMHPLQRLYGTAKVTRIEYEVTDRFVTGSIALAVDAPRDRQRITYDSGLRVWVNWRNEPWQVEGRTLPQWGFLALGPDTEVWTARTTQGMADYARCPEFMFADARTHFQMPSCIKPVVDIEPAIRSFRWLGDRRAEITYEWRVGEDVREYYGCFVHFLNRGASRRDMIAGQGDHSLARATNTWRKNDVIVDGPHVVTFPDGFNDFEIVIGLASRKGRVKMKGTDREGIRYLIGVLHIPDDGQGRLGDLVGARTKYDQELAALEADFTRNMNNPGTWIDFGTVATNGAVKINRGANRLTVFPYPRNRTFTVELDTKSLGLTAPPAKVRILKAGSDEVLEEIPFENRGGRIRFAVGKEGAGRYLILP